MANNEFEQKMAQYQNRIGQMSAEEIRDFFAELSPFIQASTKDDKAQQAEADFKKGKDNSLAIKSLLAVFNRLITLSQNATKEKADLLIELLELFIASYGPNSLPSGKKHYYDKAKMFEEYGISVPKRNVLGEIVVQYVDQKEEFSSERVKFRGNELRATLKKLQEIKAGTAQTEENTANQDNNNQTNETNNNSDQTNSNDTQLAAEKKVKAIIKSANAALTSSDLGVVEKATAELNNLWFSNNQWEKEEFAKQGGEDLINKLLDRQEQLKNSGPQGENNQKDDPIQPDRAAAITEIADKLTERGVKISELSNDYHDYQAKMKGFTNLNQINNFKNNMLAAIAAKAQEKQDAEEMDDKVRNNSQKTGAELNEALKEIADDHGKKSYEKNRDQIEADKRRAAAADAEAYRRDTALPSLAKIMIKNEITENELDAATQTQYENLKNGEIAEPDAIIAAEKLITEKISQQGASKKLNHLLTQAKKVLKSGQKSQVETALKELVAFTIADNVYWQQAYEAQPEAKSLLSQLQNYSGQNNTQNPTPGFFRPQVLIPLFLILVLLGGIIFLIIRRRNDKRS
ncbi:MAG: hypothetical protein MRERV_17c041 [Mycoplasmataceae bacterium RV_VA103A]|nr:MAG: hypothetical protein MRERV_17c041 [Mycoplasmataceae bacterium RV_VA103A]